MPIDGVQKPSSILSGVGGRAGEERNPLGESLSVSVHRRAEQVSECGGAEGL